jgi:DUF2937 family protein
MLSHYLRLIVFAFGLLVGVQVPGFVDQYAKRVSAHQIEAVRALSGFQETANTYYAGSIEALIAHHTASADLAFQDEAKSIRQLFDRVTVLNAELAALRGSLAGRIAHVALRSNREIFAETRTAYSYTVPLDPPAIASGIIIGALLALAVDAVLALIVLALSARTHRSHRAAHGR